MAGGFVPVVVSSTEEGEPAKLLPAPPDIEPSSSGRMEIALADGPRAACDAGVDESSRGKPSAYGGRACRDACAGGGAGAHAIRVRGGKPFASGFPAHTMPA